MSDEAKISAEVAEADFLRWAEAMDLDVDPNGMTDADKKSLLDCQRVFVRAVARGRLVISAEGVATYTPVGSQESVVFYPPTGAALTARDKKREGHEQAKMLATLATMTRRSEHFFETMAMPDLKVCQAVMLLLLA